MCIEDPVGEDQGTSCRLVPVSFVGIKQAAAFFQDPLLLKGLDLDSAPWYKNKTRGKGCLSDDVRQSDCRESMYVVLWAPGAPLRAPSPVLPHPLRAKACVLHCLPRRAELIIWNPSTVRFVKEDD